MFDIVTMPFIILVVYIMVELTKKKVFNTDERRKLIPACAAVVGGLIGTAMYLIAPNVMAQYANIVEACTAGMASGLAATGCNQVYKQFKKYSVEIKATGNEEETTE